MKRNLVFTLIAVTLMLALVLPTVASAQGPGKDGRGFKPGNQTIAEIAVSNGNFSTLVAALSCTGLVGAVADEDAELTVFAPTDAAFGALGLNAGNVCAAFDNATLSNILLYHVTGERRPSPSVISGQNKSIMMLAGGAIYPEGNGSLTINANNSTVNIVAADVMASNGIIHVIDGVLLP